MTITVLIMLLGAEKTGQIPIDFNAVAVEGLKTANGIDDKTQHISKLCKNFLTFQLVQVNK
jgi:hypothetical protein